MFKIVALGLLAMVAGGFAEPPSSYLPPQSRNTPSGRYGAPFGGSQGGGKALSHHSQRSGTASFSYNSLHADDNTYKSALGGLDYSNGFAGLSQQYGAPFASDSRVGGLFASGVGSAGFGDFKISQEYGAPSFSGSENGFGTAFGSGFSSNHRFGASQQFGVPSYAAGGSSFGSPSLSFDGVGSTIGLGISGFGASHSSDASSYRSGFGSTGLGLSHQYGVPSSGASFKSHTGNSAGMTFGSAGSAHRFGVSQQYGAPGFRAGSGFGSSSSVSSNHGNKLGAYSAQFGSPSPVYGVPGSSSGADYSRATEITVNRLILLCKDMIKYF